MTPLAADSLRAPLAELHGVASGVVTPASWRRYVDDPQARCACTSPPVRSAGSSFAKGAFISESVPEQAVPAASTFYAVPLGRFVIFALLSWGLYDIYWMYRNWRLLDGRDRSAAGSFVKALFSGITFFFLAVHVERARGRSTQPAWVVGFAYLFFVCFLRLPEPWSLLACGRVIPLAFTARSIAVLTGKQPPSRIEAWQVALCVLGALLTAGLVVSALFPKNAGHF